MSSIQVRTWENRDKGNGEEFNPQNPTKIVHISVKLEKSKLYIIKRRKDPYIEFT